MAVVGVLDYWMYCAEKGAFDKALYLKGHEPRKASDPHFLRMKML